MTQLRVSWFPILLLITVACTTPPPTDTAGSTTMETQPATQTTGSNQVVLSAEPRGTSNVLLTLRNGSGSPVGYNLCSSTLQRRTGNGWQAVPTDEMCTMEIRELKPGASATFQKTLPANAGRGEYRYVTTVDRPEGRLEVASNTFVVS